MWKKVLRAAGWLFGILALAVGLLFAAAYITTEQRAAKTYPVPLTDIAVPTDATAIEQGRHFATVRGCLSCHGPDLGGEVLFDVPPIGTVYSSNLTTGQNGIAARYSDAELARAIRYGLRADGTSVLVMPSHELTGISAEELGQLIAYIRSVPPVDTQPLVQRFAPLGRVLVMLGQLPAYTAELVDFERDYPAVMPPAASVEYGEYLAITCTGCHNPAFSGGPLPGAQEGDPPAMNLTQGGELIGWTLEDFKLAVTTGLTPSGRQLRDDYMPWSTYAELTDIELEAIWLYLKSLPPRQYQEQ